MSMTQKKCGKCEKTVYPTEEIQCLDKVRSSLSFLRASSVDLRVVLAQRLFEMFGLWIDIEREERQRLRSNTLLSSVGHQLSLSLSSIFTRLRLRRHYPQPKPTAVTDNPEMQRMRFLTDIQSTVGTKKALFLFVRPSSFTLGEIPRRFQSKQGEIHSRDR